MQYAVTRGKKFAIRSLEANNRSISRWARASRSPGVPLCARPVAGVVMVVALSSGRSFSFCVTFVVLCGPILVAVPGAGGGKWIVVGGYSVGRGGGTNGFFFVAMV